jgi:excinuclease ABC subunit C
MQSFINQLRQCMAGEAAQFNYERATTYRDLIKSLAYISHLLHDYKRLTTGELVLKIPVRDGEKLFFISKGRIVLKKYFPALTQPAIAAFLDEGSRVTASVATDWDEKTAIDFQNILFSEIQSLPDEWILKINQLDRSRFCP